jgi:hypothetical protein
MALAGCSGSATTTPAAAAKADSKDDQEGVTLTPEQIEDLGIDTEPASAATYRQAVAGYGSVIALDVVAQAAADIETATAVAQQSAAAVTRARSLVTGDEAAVSREVVEAAQSKAAADAVALSLAERKFQAVFGLDMPWKTTAERRDFVTKLASGQVVLARLTFPLGSLGGARPQEIAVTSLGNAVHSWPCQSLWVAPADPNLPGSGYFCLLEGSNFAQNERLMGSVRVGAEASGVWVPHSAVLVGENAMWVSVEPAPGQFVRVKVDAGKLDGAGLFLDDSVGITPDQDVVTEAAGLLLARELNPASDGD